MHSAVKTEKPWALSQPEMRSMWPTPAWRGQQCQSDLKRAAGPWARVFVRATYAVMTASVAMGFGASVQYAA